MSATGGGTLVGNEVHWSLGTLPGNQSGRQQVIVRLGQDLAAGAILQTDANITGVTLFGAESARAVATTRVQASEALQVAVEVTPDSVRRGESINSGVTVTNHGDSELSGVVLQVRVPEDGPGGAEYLTSRWYVPRRIHCV